MRNHRDSARWFDRLGLAIVAVLSAFTFFILSDVAVVAAEPTQIIIDEAQEMIAGTGANKGNDTLVLKFCYPTAKSLTKIDYLSKTTANDGSFSLKYQYSYKDNDNDPAYFNLRFYFNAKGKLIDARPVTSEHSSFWPPMSTAEITLGLAKEAIRSDEKLKNEPLWKALLKVDSASEFMVGVMNIKAGK